MEVNFFAPVEMTRAALPLCAQGSRPMVVNIGSILGHRGVPSYTEYCASKFAAARLQRVAAGGAGRLGNRRAGGQPGTTRTEFFDSRDQCSRPPAGRCLGGVPAETVARRIDARHPRAAATRSSPVVSGRCCCGPNRLFAALAERWWHDLAERAGR